MHLLLVINQGECSILEAVKTKEAVLLVPNTTEEERERDQVSISNAVLIISFLGETRALLFFYVVLLPLLPIGLVLLSD